MVETITHHQTVSLIKAIRKEEKETEGEGITSQLTLKESFKFTIGEGIVISLFSTLIIPICVFVAYSHWTPVIDTWTRRDFKIILAIIH